MSQQKPSFGQAFKGFLVWFLFFYVLFFFLGKMFPPEDSEVQAQDIKITVQDATLSLGNLARFTVHNGGEEALVFDSPCAGGESHIAVYGILGENRTDNLLNTEDCESSDLSSFTVEPGDKQDFDLRFFNGKTFQDAGQYVLEMEIGGEVISSPTIRYSEPGIFRKLFRAIISKPLFNLLVFFIKYLPNHSLGWSIILLTLVVRLILIGPNQKAMKSQYELQKIQPQLNELKAKYKNNPQMMAQKTMELYRVHQINPMGSLLPLLAQFPVLIGTYLIITDGVSPHLNHLLYSFNTIDLSIIDNDFLWLHLERPDPYFILPVAVAAVQFVTMKLSFARAAKKKKDKAPAQDDMAASMQKTMSWVMPLMIGGFTAVFPSGVGVYWFTSTLLGAIQQNLVRRSFEKPELNVVKRVEK